jgi:hypothetical protein
VVAGREAIEAATPQAGKIIVVIFSLLLKA